MACGGCDGFVRRISVFTLYLPGALGAAGTAWLVWLFGRRWFGERAALVGAIAVMLSSAGVKWFGLARTDGVFAFTVTLAACLFFHAWQGGRGWTWAWLAAAAATLAKGPLGVVLAAGGLLAAFWPGSRAKGERVLLNGKQLLGIALFLATTGGWLAAAWFECGQALIDKMLGTELVGHVTTDKHFPGTLIWQQPL